MAYKEEPVNDVAYRMVPVSTPSSMTENVNAHSVAIVTDNEDVSCSESNLNSRAKSVQVGFRR